jgi:hypothetical protein
LQKSQDLFSGFFVLFKLIAFICCKFLKQITKKEMAKKTEIKNMVQLRDSLLETYNQLKDGEIGTKEAKESSNLAGKIVSTVKAQMEYYTMTKADGKITFMEC